MKKIISIFVVIAALLLCGCQHKQEKTIDGYNFVIDSKIITISDFLNMISKKIIIDDVEIDNENIDNIIVNLYKEYQI